MKRMFKICSNKVCASIIPPVNTVLIAEFFPSPSRWNIRFIELISKWLSLNFYSVFINDCVCSFLNYISSVLKAAPFVCVIWGNYSSALTPFSLETKGKTACFPERILITSLCLLTRLPHLLALGKVSNKMLPVFPSNTLQSHHHMTKKSLIAHRWCHSRQFAAAVAVVKSHCRISIQQWK